MQCTVHPSSFVSLLQIPHSSLQNPNSNSSSFIIKNSQRREALARRKNWRKRNPATQSPPPPPPRLSLNSMANSKDSNSRVFKIWIIASWYFSNISVLFLNKYLLTNNGFKRPIFLTMCHMMTACSLLSYVAIMWMEMVRMQKLRSVLEDGRTMGRVLHLGG
ncbi:hypothetical protein MRB53_018896 [Persea americana]|uniref:Uncharacterized protein n=1 Tax=Persea americana TaxID=3435 RepID=A0ACC2M984_PERAE|nr:hypothetical protein MRB53_018896 [Persea americana]